MGRPTHLPEHLHPTWWTVQKSIEWLDRRDPTKPFFLKTSFARPHSPYDPPQVYYEMYRDRAMPPPYMSDWAAMHDDPATAAKVEGWRGRQPDAQIDRARAPAIAGNITFIDHQIGRLIYELRRIRSELWHNTLIIFFSDHGDMLGDHNLWRKTYGYEGSARVPMIVRPPDDWRVQRGLVRDEVVEIRDVMPTLLEAAGLPVPDTCQGQSMMPLVLGQQIPWRNYLHGEHSWCYSHEQAMHYLTDGREKYIWLAHLGKEQLFDLTGRSGRVPRSVRRPTARAKRQLSGGGANGGTCTSGLRIG